MNSSFIVILFVFFISTARSTDVNSCTSGTPLPEVEIKDCKGPTCVFYKNTTGIMTMKFKSPRYLEHIAPTATAFLGPIPIPYGLDQDDACEGVTNTPCPLAEGEYVEYTFGMFVDPNFPAITVQLEFSLVDQDRNSAPFECFRIDLTVANP